MWLLFTGRSHQRACNNVEIWKLFPTAEYRLYLSTHIYDVYMHVFYIYGLENVMWLIRFPAVMCQAFHD